MSPVAVNALAFAVVLGSTEAFRVKPKKRVRPGVTLHDKSAEHKRHTEQYQPWAACGVRGAGSKRNGTNINIINGDDAATCDWRWQVGLRETLEKRPFCGGMLISPGWVLTAAHCAAAPGLNVLAGITGLNSGESTEQHRWASQVIRHPSYDVGPPSASWDIALIRLESPMEMGECVGTVCMPSGGDITPGSKCWITGWGSRRQRAGSMTGQNSMVDPVLDRTPGATSSLPTTLQEAQVTIVSNEDCVKQKGYTQAEIGPSEICAQGLSSKGVTDACQGDSGGPLVCESEGKYSIYGATSWGKGCGDEHHPGVWARIYEAYDWIQHTIETTTGPPPARKVCASFTKAHYADFLNHCNCPDGLFCSRNGGLFPGCPTALADVDIPAPFFSQSCTDCTCHAFG